MPKPSKLKLVSFREVGQRVRALRLQHGLTQTQLARKLGTTQTAVSEIELGGRGVSLQQVVKLARALGASPNDVLGETARRASTETPAVDAKILRRLYRIQSLPASQQQAILKLLDGIIAAHAKRSA